MGTLGVILSWIIFGLLVGAIARFLMPGRQPMSWLMTCVLGIAGSFAGGFIYSLIAGLPMDQLHYSRWIGSILGALLLLFIYGYATKNRTA